MNKLILASNSPRRREILSTLNIPFEVIPSNIDEKIDHNKNLREEIERLSFLKALDIFKDHKDSVVIGSDTIVVIGEEVLGKPKDKEDAYRMLRLLQNNKHHVITAVSIISPNKSETFSSVSDVYFNPMSEEEIKDYVETGEPMDKAGAYGIQGLGGRFVKKIDGDYYSIIGFPLNLVYNRLKKYL